MYKLLRNRRKLGREYLRLNLDRSDALEALVRVKYHIAVS